MLCLLEGQFEDLSPFFFSQVGESKEKLHKRRVTSASSKQWP
jgi:hypothetical protein